MSQLTHDLKELLKVVGEIMKMAFGIILIAAGSITGCRAGGLSTGVVTIDSQVVVMIGLAVAALGVLIVDGARDKD